MVSNMQGTGQDSDAEIRLMGLILAQSALVGLAIGVFDADLWLKSETPMLNGFTYAMAAFFVQGIAYYFFKMFFEQNMQERVRATGVQRSRDARYKQMQMNFDNRRVEMEMRMQEAQLERELRWMEANPGKMPPSWGVPGGSQSIVSQYDSGQFNPGIPSHEVEVDQPINLGIKEEEGKEEKKKK
jgi:hypothetical protein|tara:strand:+ start:1823 stop:2377 length:555 start_codon:yes stop_codon:yes gene_type:complete